MEDPGQSQATKSKKSNKSADATTSAAPAPEHVPTRDEAREMFKDNPGLWSVITTDGPMTRDQC